MTNGKKTTSKHDLVDKIKQKRPFSYQNNAIEIQTKISLTVEKRYRQRCNAYLRSKIFKEPAVNQVLYF